MDLSIHNIVLISGIKTVNTCVMSYILTTVAVLLGRLEYDAPRALDCII